MLCWDSEDEMWSGFVFELVIWPNRLLCKGELNPWVRCAFGNVSQYNCWKTYPEPWIYSYCIDFMLKKPCVKSQNLQKKPIWKKCSVGAGESIKENPPKIIRYLIKHLCLNNKSLPKGPFPPSRAWVGLSQRDQWAFSGQCTKLLPANTNTEIVSIV